MSHYHVLLTEADGYVIFDSKFSGYDKAIALYKDLCEGIHYRPCTVVIFNPDGTPHSHETFKGI